MALSLDVLGIASSARLTVGFPENPRWGGPVFGPLTYNLGMLSIRQALIALTALALVACAAPGPAPETAAGAGVAPAADKPALIEFYADW